MSTQLRKAASRPAVDVHAVPTCPLCQSRARTFLYTGREHEYGNIPDQEFHFYRCDDCGLLYLSPRPADTAFPVIYPPNYYSRATDYSAPDAVDLGSPLGRLVHSRVVARIMGNISPYLDLRPGHRYLEVGCGGGRVLASVRAQTGCDTYGIDLDIPAEVTARFSAPPIKLYMGNFLTFDSGGEQFDVVYASHLIEHLPSPVDFLRKCHSLLRPRGLCVFETPNAECRAREWFGVNWGGHHIPRHFFLLGERSARRAVIEAVGDRLEVLTVRPAVSRFFWIWTFHGLLCRAGFRRAAGMLFPSDHRSASLSVLGIARHGFFTALDMATSRLTGTASAIAVVLRRTD